MIQVGKHQIDESRLRNGKGKTTCPNCVELGKTNVKDTCLSVDIHKQVFNCHKCGWKGTWKEFERKEPIKQYKKPNIEKARELNESHQQYFSKRGISQRVTERNRIKSMPNDYFAFMYYEGEEVVNFKARNAKEKRFFQSPEARQTMYKFNDIVNQPSIIICEGEIDALSWEEAGFEFATSVSQGAPNVNDTNIEKKLECIYNNFDLFEQTGTIYLSVDNDENGKRLERELIKIFTAEKIKIISFDGLIYGENLTCKDANDVLIHFGKDELKKRFISAKEINLDGIFECRDFESEILDSYRHGQPKGTTTYFNCIDEVWTHRKGEVNIWTGYNNEGKSLLLKQLLLLKSKFEGWKHAVYSPEEMPFSEWYTDLIESYIGKSADKTQESYRNYMSEDQIKSGIEFMQDHFYTVYPTEEQSLEEILKRFSYLVRKKNIQTVVLDPYNQIQHLMQKGEREDLYISRFMARLKKFAVEHDVAVHLVAHQLTPHIVKQENYPEPNIYTIKGGGTFADKADNVLVVWREFRNTDIKNTDVKFISKKIKKQKLTGKPGTALLKYDSKTNRYLENFVSPFNKQIEEIKPKIINHYENDPFGIFEEQQIQF